MLKCNGKSVLVATGVVAAALVLSGCQSVFGSSTAARGEAQNIDMSDYFESRLAVGRHYLEKGLTTQAVVAFRQASYDPRFAGEAYNGMAVAYDRLGRTDLAHRYFTMAVAAAPGDNRFSRNLARLEGQMPVMPDAMPQERAEAAQGELPALPVDESRLAQIPLEKPRLKKRGPVTIGMPPSNSVVVATKPSTDAVRVSRAEVRLTQSASPSSHQPVVRAAAHAAQRADSRAVPPRVQRNGAIRRGYPIRLVFNDDKPSLYDRN